MTCNTDNHFLDFNLKFHDIFLQTISLLLRCSSGLSILSPSLGARTQPTIFTLHSLSGSPSSITTYTPHISSPHLRLTLIVNIQPVQHFIKSTSVPSSLATTFHLHRTQASALAHTDNPYPVPYFYWSPNWTPCLILLKYSLHPQSFLYTVVQKNRF